LAAILIVTQVRVEVKGHTDNVGSEEVNMELSKERAKAVVRYLIREGVDKDKISYSYYGMSKPLTTNDTEEGRTMNRRVEFEILGN
jgi:OOP family OmpA-OmpF porin